MDKADLYKTYYEGVSRKETLNKIINLESDAGGFSDDFFRLLDYIMDVVADNFAIIQNELYAHNFYFENIGGINDNYKVFEKQNDFIGEKINSHFNTYGYLPLSFLFFMKKIKNIDFRGSFKSLWDHPFFLDPIYIYDADTFLIINDEPYKLHNDSEIYVLISPDEFVKENVSGDIGYGLNLHSKIVADSELINFNIKMNFLDYLRLSLKWCGLAGLEFFSFNEIPENINSIIVSIRKKLKEI